VPDKYSTAATDNYRLARSKYMVSPGDGTYNIIHIPKFAFVKRVWTVVETAFTAPGATLTVGFIGNGEAANTDAFMDSSNTQPTLIGTRSSSEDNREFCQGKYFNTARGAITVTTDDNAGTAGKFYVIVEYSVLK